MDVQVPRWWPLLFCGSGCMDYALHHPGPGDLADTAMEISGSGGEEGYPAWDDLIQTVTPRPDAGTLFLPTDADAVLPTLRENCAPGYEAVYYNHSADHPDMRSPPEGLRPGDHPLHHDWFEESAVWARRVDPDLQFGEGWWPVDGGLEGDPAHYAVRWRGWFVLEEARLLTFVLGVDDDAWVLIDDVLVADQGGIHPLDLRPYTIVIAEGAHHIDIFDAERDAAADGMWFAWEDTVDVWACGDL